MTTEQIRIKKRDGSLMPIDFSKINNVVMHACSGLNASASEIINNAKIQFVDGATTERIQEILIQTARSMISIDQPDYSIACARLDVYDIRKRAYGSYQPPSLLDHVVDMVARGVYDPVLLKEFDKSEFAEFELAIDHDRDNDFTTAAMGQLADKYLLRDRSKGDRAFYESPQMSYMCIAMSLFSVYPKGKQRTSDIIKFYEGASTFMFSLPTPIMAGVRTPTRQFSSCVLIKCGDSLSSINATANAIVNYVSKRAGIGIDESAIRAIGSPIRKGEMVHTGVVPFLKYHVGALKSCSQGGIRGGSATVYYPWWHYQIEDIVVLKNSRGTNENRERRVDYGIQWNGLLWQRFLNQEDIWLLDPNDVPEMYNSFFEDQSAFADLYAAACHKAETGKIRGKKMKASDLVDLIVEQRSETGRIYIAFIDNMNVQSPFIESIHPVYSSNLCLEIALPTRSFESEFDMNGRIALCTLASFNMDKFNTLEDMMGWARVLVRALDGLLDFQDYPMIQAKLATEDFRTLGVGVVNLATYLAKLGLKYGEPETLQVLNEWFESFAYALTKASVELAKERGACARWKETHYGWNDDCKFPHELCHPGVFRLIEGERKLNDKWEELRAEIKAHGIRNATLMAVAPTESSSQVLNATNGIEMPTDAVSIKSSKSGNFKQIIPYPELKDQYEYVWDQASPGNYLKTMAVIQRWIDQAISSNTAYNPEFFAGNKIPRSLIVEDLLEFYCSGGKTLYYSKMPDGAGEQEVEEMKVVDEKPEDDGEEICETCVI